MSSKKKRCFLLLLNPLSVSLLFAVVVLAFSYQGTVKKSNAKRFSTSLRDLVESTETFESIHPTTSVKVLELEHTDEEYSFFTNDPYFL